MAERHTKSRAPRCSVRSLVPMRPSRSVLLHSGWTVRTRGGSRTPNTPGLSRRPLPLGYPGGYAVLFVLRTSYFVLSYVDKVGLEPTASAVRERRSTG